MIYPGIGKKNITNKQNVRPLLFGMPDYLRPFPHRLPASRGLCALNNICIFPPTTYLPLREEIPVQLFFQSTLNHRFRRSPPAFISIFLKKSNVIVSLKSQKACLLPAIQHSQNQSNLAKYSCFIGRSFFKAMFIIDVQLNIVRCFARCQKVN